MENTPTNRIDQIIIQNDPETMTREQYYKARQGSVINVVDDTDQQPSPVIAVTSVQLIEPNWQARANCKGLSPDYFVAKKGDAAQEKAARAVCASCVVLDSCRENALTAPKNSHGIVGGLSEKERRAIRKERKG